MILPEAQGAEEEADRGGDHTRADGALLLSARALVQGDGALPNYARIRGVDSNRHRSLCYYNNRHSKRDRSSGH
jgi:hypothetical protein